MSYLETIQELLEAKEGEHVQFKEASADLTPEKQQNAAVHWRIMAAESWFLALQIKDPAW
mgnify:CR=1 FL=1